MKSIVFTLFFGVSFCCIALDPAVSAWERAASRNSGSGGGTTLSDWLYWSKKAAEDISNENFYEAIRSCQKFLNACNRDFDKISPYIDLAMLYWNTGNKSRAVSSMQTAVYYLKNAYPINGRGCEIRGEKFLQKMRSGNLPARFSGKDIGGIGLFIMQAAYAMHSQRMAALNAYYDALGAKFSAQTSLYRREGEFQEKMAKFYAAQEYQKATGRSFSPNHPPAYGTSARSSWETCKKIYDIFN